MRQALDDCGITHSALLLKLFWPYCRSGNCLSVENHGRQVESWCKMHDSIPLENRCISTMVVGVSDDRVNDIPEQVFHEQGIKIGIEITVQA